MRLEIRSMWRWRHRITKLVLCMYYQTTQQMSQLRRPEIERWVAYLFSFFDWFVSINFFFKIICLLQCGRVAWRKRVSCEKLKLYHCYQRRIILGKSYLPRSALRIQISRTNQYPTERNLSLVYSLGTLNVGSLSHKFNSFMNTCRMHTLLVVSGPCTSSHQKECYVSTKSLQNTSGTNLRKTSGRRAHVALLSGFRFMTPGGEFVHIICRYTIIKVQIQINFVDNNMVWLLRTWINR